MGTLDMKIYGESELARFAAKYPSSRKPLQRFLAIARAAEWMHFPDVKQSFRATDYVPASGRMIFNIGGNKYRLTARVDFEQQALQIERIQSHEQYDRG
jgi:mRNA interferase HigB